MTCIKKKIQQIKSWIRTESRTDSAISDLIRFFYKVASHSYCQVIVSIVETTILGIFIEKDYYGLFFWITLVLYTIMMILIAWANEHIRDKIKDNKTFQSALFGLSTVLKSWAINMQKTAKGLNGIDVRENRQTVERLLNAMDLQTAAFAVCEKLHDFLTRNGNPDDVYITVFQRYKDGGKNMCRMIAYSGNHEPTSYDVKYEIPEYSEDLLGNIEYHTYIFASGNKDVTSFPNPESLSKVFKFHPGCENRESRIQQLICIPISPAKKGVTLLLQVDTSISGVFGSTDTAVDEFAKNTVYPFAQFLHMMYEQVRVIDQLIK